MSVDNYSLDITMSLFFLYRSRKEDAGAMHVRWRMRHCGKEHQWRRWISSHPVIYAIYFISV